MARKVEDIIPANHRSVKDIPLGKNSKGSSRSKKEKDDGKETHLRISIQKEKAAEEANNDQSSPDQDKFDKRPAFLHEKKAKRKPERSGKWFLLALGITIVVAGLAYTASLFFSRANFVVVPKTAKASANGGYMAYAKATSSESIIYKINTSSAESDIIVPATEGPLVSSKAKGTVTIYNSYNTAGQKLVAGTRISPESGKIYRLTISVVVPGYTLSKGTKVPGKITATIEADQPGASYNISGSDNVSDFKLPGYKGTSRYESIYARISTPITGGYYGKKVTVDQKVLASTTKYLEEKTSALAIADSVNATPKEFLRIDKACKTAYSKPSIQEQQSSTTAKAKVSLKADMTCLYLNTESLVRSIAGKEKVDLFGGKKFDIKGLEEIDFSIMNLSILSADTKSPIALKIKGDIELVGYIPVEEIRQKLVGKPISETKIVLKDYNSVIESVSGELIPPWSRVPLNIDRIFVTIKQR